MASKIFKDRLTDQGRNIRPSDKGDYKGPHRNKPGIKNLSYINIYYKQKEKRGKVWDVEKFNYFENVFPNK